MFGLTGGVAESAARAGTKGISRNATIIGIKILTFAIIPEVASGGEARHDIIPANSKRSPEN